MSVSHLIAACIRQDRSAQGQVYTLLAPKMFVVCMRYSRSREEAEESLQEGFLKVFTCIDQLKSMNSFEGLVRKIMVNCTLQKFRNKPVLYHL